MTNMTKPATKRDGPQLLLRFPPGSDLRDRLAEIAERNQRSLSAEIIFRLDMSLRSLDERLDQHSTEIETATQLAYADHISMAELEQKIERIALFCREAAEKIGIEAPNLDLGG
jgi:hypothetical protein